MMQVNNCVAFPEKKNAMSEEQFSLFSEMILTSILSSLH